MGSGSSSGGDWGHGAPQNPHIIYKIGIYGWRKRCLYLFILFVLIIVIINISLTIWILKVMDFSIHGMGKLRIVDGGVRVEGNSEFLKAAHASQITSRKGSPLSIESARNITMNARDEKGKVTNRLFIGDEKIQSYAKQFEIYNADGKILFAAEEDEVLIGADQLQVSGELGATFLHSVQTPLVRPEDSSKLRLESPSKSILIQAPKGVHIQAPVGGMTLKSALDIRIQSRENAIRLNSRDINFKNLFVSTPRFDGRAFPEVYQLCVCEKNGRLFLSPSRGNCEATSTVCS